MLEYTHTAETVYSKREDCLFAEIDAAGYTVIAFRPPRGAELYWAPTEEVTCADSCTRYNTPRLILKKKPVRRRVLTETGECRSAKAGEWYENIDGEILRARWTHSVLDKIYAENFVEVVPK